MRNEGWRLKDEWWKLKDEGWRFKDEGRMLKDKGFMLKGVMRTDEQKNRWTDGQTDICDCRVACGTEKFILGIYFCLNAHSRVYICFLLNLLLFECTLVSTFKQN